ncbi:hairy-related 3 [Lepisosteus oculatus]|uniref:hairy-related 3 n=1 Tax=Lepisosteus oculatus TaxID=7918 RepID=UPI0037142619
MVAASESPEKTVVLNGKKVSKPLMEKKRRARINECLEQLKTLLENHYTNNIRKRKLEKADILELTVKHLRNLHKYQQDSSINPLKHPEYQAGFRNCLNGVNQYLMRENSTGSIRLNMLKHLSSSMLAAGEPASCNSTADSDAAEHWSAEAASPAAPRGVRSARERLQRLPVFCHPLVTSAPETSASIFSTRRSSETVVGGQHHDQHPSSNGLSNVCQQAFLKDDYPSGRYHERQCSRHVSTSTGHACIISQSYWRPW